MKNIVNSINESFSSKFTRLNESLDENTYSDFQSDIYNALGNVFFKYREVKPSEEDFDRAMEWFNTHFWESDDFEESLEEALDPNMVDILKLINQGLDLAERYVLSGDKHFTSNDQKVVERSKEYLGRLRNYLSKRKG